MIQEELQKIAREIIENNSYLTLATSHNNTPWVAPLFYAVDPHFTFYFISQLDSFHIQHVQSNPKVAFAIFDSHQKEGTGNGVQAVGTVSLVKNEELSEAFKWYQTTFLEMKEEMFKEPHPYRFFKITPKHFYILDPDAKTDKRVEVYVLKSPIKES